MKTFIAFAALIAVASCAPAAQVDTSRVVSKVRQVAKETLEENRNQPAPVADVDPVALTKTAFESKF